LKTAVNPICVAVLMKGPIGISTLSVVHPSIATSLRAKILEQAWAAWFHSDFRPGDGYGKPDTVRLARAESARLWEQCHSEGSRRCSVDLAAIVYRKSAVRGITRD